VTPARGAIGAIALLLAACAAPMAGGGPGSAGREAPWPTPVADPAQLTNDFPDSASVLRRQLGAANDARDGAAVRAGLARLAALGYAPDQQSIDTLAPYVPDTEMAALRLRFAANRATIQASRLLINVPAEHRLIEGIAWDSRTGRLFAAAVVSRALLVREAQGWRAVEGLEAGSLFGLAIDPRRRLLWAASGVVEQTPNPEGAFRGLIAVDLATLRRYVGVMAAPVYCTRTASKLARTYTDKHGLKDLVKELLDIDLSKQQQSSDWGAETLSQEQLKYAAADVLYLHQLKDKLDPILEREGRRTLAEGCFGFLPTRSALDRLGWDQPDIFEH